MSRFSHLVGSQQQPCFCCPPPSVIGPAEERHLLVSSMTHYGHPISPVSNATQVDTNSITDLISDIHLDNQNLCDNAITNDNSALRSQPPQVDALQGHFCNLKINMRALQSRELGMSRHNAQKVSPASGMSMANSGQGSIGAKSQSSSVPKSGTAMDLDLALDELGMLSTVTNSRREYLVETHNHKSAFSRRDKSLKKKSVSSPNLASLSRLNGFHIIQLDNKYVTNVSSNRGDVSHQVTSVPFSHSGGAATLSESSRYQHQDSQLLEAAAAANRRRSVPRMSRLRKDRYKHSRCPYKIPDRLCHSMQEPDYGPDYFKTCPTPFSLSISSPHATSNNHKSLDISTPTYLSKSNATSPAKGNQDQNLTRSHSVEDLQSVQRRLELLFDGSKSEGTEEHVDQIATQLTDIHMS